MEAGEITGSLRGNAYVYPITGSETSIPLVRPLYRHHRENMNFFLRLVDAIESRECTAYVKAIGILASLNI